jgi:hypothetical protein
MRGSLMEFLEGTAGGYNDLAPLLGVRCLDEILKNGTPCDAIGACNKCDLAHDVS